jgi:hypothetical protein
MLKIPLILNHSENLSKKESIKAFQFKILSETLHPLFRNAAKEVMLVFYLHRYINNKMI